MVEYRNTINLLNVRPLPAEDIEIIFESKLFDVVWYRQMNGDLHGMDPIEHYLHFGAELGLAPSKSFDGLAYTRTNSDIGVMNPLLHYLRHGSFEGRNKGMPGSVGALLKRELPALAQFEPDLMTEDRFFTKLESIPLVSSLPESRAASCWQQIFKLIDFDIEHLIFIPWLVRGGADLAAVNVFKALQQRYGKNKVALIATDYADLTAFDWLPEKSKFFMLATATCFLEQNDRRIIVEKLIWTLRPKSLFNVNSRACWEAMAQTGRALSQITEINALLFCKEYKSDGRSAGYSDTHLRAALPHLHRVYFDTKYFMKEQEVLYGLPPSFSAKFHYLPQPVTFSVSRIDVSRKHSDLLRKRILWAGRFSAQKNIDLLIKIVELGTEFEFDIWGSGQADITEQLKLLNQSHDNIHLRGAFASLDELPLAEYTAFLFTSHYEGMPTIILNIAAAGLPIVATSVGGVSELVDEGTGWPIADCYDPNPYIDAMKEIVTNGTLSRLKREAMRLRLEKERTPQIFYQELFC